METQENSRLCTEKKSIRKQSLEVHSAYESQTKLNVKQMLPFLSLVLLFTCSINMRSDIIISSGCSLACHVQLVTVILTDCSWLVAR